MSFEKLASYLIPGYEFLPQKARANFEACEAGQHFIAGIEEVLELQDLFKQKYSSIFSPFYASYAKDKDELQIQCAAKLDNIRNEINCRAYRSIVRKTIINRLEQRFSEFSFLKPHQKHSVARAEFSKSIPELIRLEQNLEETTDVYEKMAIEAEVDKHFELWLYRFSESKAMALLRKRITKQSGKQRVKELVELLPLLKEQSDSLNRSAEQEFKALYWFEGLKERPDFKKLEENFLRDFLFSYLQPISENYLTYTKLHSFNKDMAEVIAQKIIESSGKKTNFSLIKCIDDYSSKLQEFLIKQLSMVKNIDRLPEYDKDSDDGLINSLSHLFWQSKTISQSSNFLIKLADAHAFIQYTGMATQNESSYLVILDLFNYNRTLDQVLETKSIIYSLLKPFVPLYEEYRQIALGEKNTFFKIARIIMPLIVIAAVVALILFMFTPLALPEFALILIAIPALILGTFLASQYVTWKNDVSQYIYQNYLHDGPFEIPEFKINSRMIKIFGNKETADLIRTIYIEEFKHCDAQENCLKNRAELGELTEEEIEQRRKNIETRLTLSMEWYDIHSNINTSSSKGLGIDKVPAIVEQRLIKLFNEKLQLMKKTSTNSKDLQIINAIVLQISNQLKARFTLPKKQNGTLSAFPSSQVSLDTMRFFKPKNLPIQKKAEQVDEALDRIRNLPSPSF
ncbi:MAG: hypothetical protein H0U70_01510 [Tatlockia sp.]|nr:hypothetical protein [Tatlockia sp.]